MVIRRPAPHRQQKPAGVCSVASVHCEATYEGRMPNYRAWWVLIAVWMVGLAAGRPVCGLGPRRP